MLCQSGGDPESCYIVRKRGLDRDLEEVELGGQGPRDGVFIRWGDVGKRRVLWEACTCGSGPLTSSKGQRRGPSGGDLKWEED